MRVRKADSVSIPAISSPSVAAACGHCRFSALWQSRLPGSMTVLRCRRYPAPLEIATDDWCGEYKEKPDVDAGNAGI